jgi:hypothetical protein
MAWWRHVPMWHLARWWYISALALVTFQPVLREVYTDLCTFHPFSREPDRSINTRGFCILYMAEQCATAFAAIQSHLPDLPTFREELDNHLFCALGWKTTNPDSSTIIWFCLLWLRPILAHAISCDRFIFCVI